MNLLFQWRSEYGLVVPTVLGSVLPDAKNIKMPRHYVKILDWLKEYAESCGRCPSESWQQVLFEDLTARGSAIKIIPIDSDYKGRRVGVAGKHFFCEAGFDESREDTLFICRIEPVAQHARDAKNAVTYNGDFYLVQQGTPIGQTLDPVETILGSPRNRPLIATTSEFLANGARGEEIELADIEPDTSQPNSALIHFLHSAPNALRWRWRSMLREPENTEAIDFVPPFQRIWRDHNLACYADIQPRLSGMLAGRIRPFALSHRERSQLLDIISVRLLNSFANAYPADDTLYHLLEDLTQLPLNAALRAFVWATMMEALTAAEFRHELRAATQALRALPKDSRHIWGAALRRAVTLISEREQSGLLKSILLDSTDQDYCRHALEILEAEPDVLKATEEIPARRHQAIKHATVYSSQKHVACEVPMASTKLTTHAPIGASSSVSPPQTYTPTQLEEPLTLDPDNNALKRQAITLLLGKPAAIILNDGTRFTATFETLAHDSVMLAEGGVLSLSDLRSFHLAQVAYRSTDEGSDFIRGPRPTPQPDLRQPSQPVQEPAVPIPTNADAMREQEVARHSTVAVSELDRIERPFRDLVLGYRWQISAVPPLKNPRSPAKDLVFATRQRANKIWSKAMDYLRNRNWSAAKAALIDLSFLTPTAMEPIWGAAYAAYEQGDPKFALALLRHRGHSLERHPELARAQVSLAIQLNALAMAMRLLRAYAREPVGLATDFLLFACRHGLYRSAIRFLSDEGSHWAEHGDALSAYLILRVYPLADGIPGDFKIDVDHLSPDLVLPALLHGAKDQPSREYQCALDSEPIFEAEINGLHAELEEREFAVGDTEQVNFFLTNAQNERRTGDYDAALRFATQGLQAAKSRQWKRKAEETIEQLQANRPAKIALYPPRTLESPTPNQPGPWLHRYLASKDRPSFQHGKSVDKPASQSLRTTFGPLWQQAAYAAADGELDSAIDLYNKFLETAVHARWDSQADRAVNGLAMVYARQGNRDEALRTMLRYREYIQVTQRFHNQLATLYFSGGQFEKAAEHFHLAAQAATIPGERAKAMENAKRSERRASQAKYTPSPEARAQADEDAEELEREYLLEVDVKAPVLMREVTLELDNFLEGDINRLLKDGTELMGISRPHVARGDFDYETIKRLMIGAQEQQRTQGVRSRYLATALFLIYQKGWHQEPAALEHFDPRFLQTRLASSLGDDAAGQSRPEVAREYYACALERDPSDKVAIGIVRDFILTITGERFDSSSRRGRWDGFRGLLNEMAPEWQEYRQTAVWSILHIAGLSQKAYAAVEEVINAVQAPFLSAILASFPNLHTTTDDFKARFDAAILLVRHRRQNVEDQFHRFRSRDHLGAHTLADQCASFTQLDTRLPYNPLDFGPEGRVVRWQKELVPCIANYFAANQPADKELRYQKALSRIALDREDIGEQATRFARRVLRPILDTWQTALVDHYNSWRETVEPDFDVRCVKVEKKDAYEYEVELLVCNARNSAPAHEVSIQLDLPGWDCRVLTEFDRRSLEGGGEEPQSWSICNRSAEAVAGSVTANVRVTHLDRDGERLSHEISLDIPIVPIPYREFENPYDPGIPVSRDDMLKGRDAQISRLVNGVSDPRRPAFFRVTGAKRVGKSSVLEAVQRRLRERPSIITTLRLDMSTSMVKGATLQEVLNLWARHLFKDATRLDCVIPEWTWDKRLPVTESFLEWLDEDVRPLAHPVLLLDEFQVIARMLDDDLLKDLLGFWKAMIERRLISGIICGQDSMDTLIEQRGFGNQFASIKPEAIDYLDEDAARALIEEPIQLPDDMPPPFEHLRGKTRFNSGAVRMILEYTAGSPFYLQYLCDSIVSTLRNQRSMMVTEMTVKKAVRQLLDRSSFGTFFENLTRFSPANTISDPATRSQEIEGRILFSIAFDTQDKRFCDIRERIRMWPKCWRDEAGSILTGLLRQRVIEANNDGKLHRIRVGLFRLWLQNNPTFGDRPDPLD